MFTRLFYNFSKRARYFLKNMDILRTRTVRNENLFGERSAQSIGLSTEMVSAAACCLLFAAFCTIAVKPAFAAQIQGNVEALLEQAHGEENAGSYEAAERTYKQALAVAPGNLEILKRLGILEQTELRFDDSIQLFKQVLASDSQYKGVNFFLGLSYFGKNDFAKSIDSFESELKTPKPHPRAQYYLGLALQSAGRIDQAISHLNQSLAEDPKDADALYELARLYKNASLHSIEMLKSLDPDSFQLHAFMGEVYADQERYSDAIEQYQAALEKR